jgi:ferrous iron transport protein B
MKTQPINPTQRQVAPPSAACEKCPAFSNAHLQKLGVNTLNSDYMVALSGNPNVGKSTVFNVLTGLRQHVGNWTGKTVARMEGAYLYNNKRYKVVDLPGTYSLLANSADEEIARDFILFGQPSVTVVVTDATRLERNLNLALQVMEITDRVVIALNLIDEAERNGINIDDRRLARDLGVPVIPMAARRGRGIPELLKAIDEVAQGVFVCKPRRTRALDPETERAIATVKSDLLTLYPNLPNARWVAMRLLDNDPSIIRELRAGTLGSITHTMAADTLMKLEVV